MSDLRKAILTLFTVIIIIITAILSSSKSHSMAKVAPTNFEYAMKIVMLHEGGLSNDKSDPGGITNFGISLRFIKDEHIDVNHDGHVNENDIIHLTKTEADSIYLVDWWNKYHYGDINNKIIAAKIMDFSVNAGASRCHRLIKLAINRITNDAIEINGILDDRTIEILNLIEPVVFHDALVVEEENFYKSIVKRNPSLKVFLKDWLNRARS